MKTKLFLLLILFNLLALGVYRFTLLKPSKPSVQGVRVTATVPAYWWLELNGWTSPWARVELRMEQYFTRTTTANEQGYFVFNLPLPRNLFPFCLLATDVANITSSPLCVPPPDLNTVTMIKEVVMPPTIKIDKGNMLADETVAVQGYTTPGSEVTPFIFEEQQRQSVPKLFSQNSNFQFLIFNQILNSKFQILNSKVYAAEVPKVPLKSDQKGYYQINLPTSSTGKNRLFIGSTFLDSPSPKSTTLVFNVLTPWQSFFNFLVSIFLSFIVKAFAFVTGITGFLITELAIIFLLAIYLLFAPKKRSRALRITSNKLLVIGNR